MIPFSILDLSQIGEGGSASEALANSARMAQAAESAGYHRYWLAEHHGMPGIASAATAIVIAHVGAVTKTIRIGSGGVMLPNHSPLVIAEQFGSARSAVPWPRRSRHWPRARHRYGHGAGAQAQYGSRRR